MPSYERTHPRASITHSAALAARETRGESLGMTPRGIWNVKTLLSLSLVSLFHPPASAPLRMYDRNAPAQCCCCCTRAFYASRADLFIVTQFRNSGGVARNLSLNISARRRRVIKLLPARMKATHDIRKYV